MADAGSSVPEAAIKAAEAQWIAFARAKVEDSPLGFVTRLLEAAAPFMGDALSECPNPMAHERPHHVDIRRNEASGGWSAACIDCRWDSGHSLDRSVVAGRAIEHADETDPAA